MLGRTRIECAVPLSPTQHERTASKTRKTSPSKFSLAHPASLCNDWIGCINRDSFLQQRDRWWNIGDSPRSFPNLCRWAGVCGCRHSVFSKPLDFGYHSRNRWICYSVPSANLTDIDNRDCNARLRLAKPIGYGNESLGSMDNKALNRSVLIARAGQSSDGRNLPLYPTTIFTN